MAVFTLSDVVTCVPGSSSSADELAVVSEALKQHLQRYGADADAAKKAVTFGESRPNPSLPEGELAAYTLAANLLLNLDETVTRN